MKTFTLMYRCLTLSVPLLLGVAPVGRAGIPEPETILYGRIVIHVGGVEYLVNQGELAWTISASIDGGGPYEFVTQLQPLANGQYCYSIKIPHEVLAYDLPVSDNVVPLTAAPWQFDHLDIRVDGHTAAILPSAELSFVVAQPSRARTHRIDLQVLMPDQDSDGDGLPDWWEDLNGYDKWDPSDGALGQPETGNGYGGENPGEAPPITFAMWRDLYFPGAQGDLQEFALLDPDEDGVANLAEYGFLLDPKANHSSAHLGHLPTAEVADGYLTLSFQPRSDAVDLEYEVEMSEDLVSWVSSAEYLEVVSPSESSGEANLVYLRGTSPITGTSRCYLRVRVSLKE